MSHAMRSIIAELNKLIDKKITVRLVDGKEYSGTLVSYDPSSLHIILENVSTSDGHRYYRVIIAGNRISEIIVEPPLFDANEFAEMLKRELGLPPGAVRVLTEINAVQVYNNIKVSEAGVEGYGELARKIFDIFNRYIEYRKKLLGKG